MNSIQYHQLAPTLQNLSKRIPLRWGAIQNDRTDSKINMFTMHTIEDLEYSLSGQAESVKDYFRRRWFLWQCAQVDEYLFYKESNVKSNPNSRSQEYDIEFNDDINLRFDVKGTVVPRSLRERFNYTMEREIIEFYYRNQSTGST